MTNKPIGGYFELELPLHSELHADAIALNGGRFCLEYLLRCRKYSKIYVPYFTCNSAIEPIIKLGIPYEFYHIDRSYRIVDDIVLLEGEALMYTNYWGLQSNYCLELSVKYSTQLILDYTQAFYSKPINGIDTFYSCRKFFGVPDGEYLYTDAKAEFDLEQDVSYTRMDSLLKRIDLSPEEGYDDFRKCSEMFRTLPIRYMSKLTKRMMTGIDYQGVAQKRRRNYEFLHRSLGGQELLSGDVPMIFPYITEAGGGILRERLIQNKVFVAKYWPNVDLWAGENTTETRMANNILPLPVDQRYGLDDMAKINELICHE